MSSSYYAMLDNDSKTRYIEKLTFKDSQLPDPLDEDVRKIVYSSRRLPNISVFDIHAYLVEKHNMYTKLAFKDYASLPCYNYVTSGKVKDLKCYRNAIGVCVVTADVEASQKAKKIHRPWIVATNDGEIISGHCTCMAGLGETCSHVGATLFLVEKIVREEREMPSCTSQPCQWIKTSSDVQPAPVYKINFRDPEKVKRVKPKKKTANVVLPVASEDCFQIFLQDVKNALPSAAIFSAVPDSENEDTDSAEEECKELTFVEAVKNCLQYLPENTSLSEKQKVFKAMFLIPDAKRRTIEVQTKGDKKIWKNERRGRITASYFGRVLKCKSAHDSILSEIMEYQKDISSESMEWGKKTEKTAQDEFLKVLSPLHVNLCIVPTGLFVDEEEPYLGATPDGLVTCDCCEDFILEIKCPFAHKGKKIDEIEKKNFFLDENNNLKEGHNYYDQVQGQMAISGISKCYFVTFTEKEMHYQIVDFDEIRWENSKTALKNFFFCVVFPEILDGKLYKALKAASKDCICQSEKNGTVVKCSHCAKTFHRSCINHRKRSAWSCETCKIKFQIQ